MDTVELPERWEVLEGVGPPFHLVAVAPDAPGFRPALTLTVEAVAMGADPNEQLRQRLHQLAARLDDHHLVDIEMGGGEMGGDEMGEGELRILSLHTRQRGPSLVSEQRVRSTSDGVHVLVLTCDALDLHRHAATFAAIVGSWRTEAPPA